MTDLAGLPRMIPSRLRRNGTRPSCENCRIAKARCDHHAPCGRCARNGKTCFFHPAPMSGASKAKRAAAKHTVSSHDIDEVDPSVRLRSNSEPALARDPVPLQTTLVSSQYRKPNALALGYMGSTSHAAILIENGSMPAGESLGEMEDDTVDRSQDEAAIKLGMAILSWLPSAFACQKVLQPLESLGTVFFFAHLRKLQHFVTGFTESFENLLREPRKWENLRQLSTVLVRNTKNPLPIPQSNEEWLASSSGENSRWEHVGQLFAGIGGIVITLSENAMVLRDILPEGIDRKSFVASMLECADSCLVLSEQLAISGNLPSVTLLQNCVQLQSLIAGDSSHEIWKRTSRLAAANISLGYHLKITPVECQSTIYLDERTRAICVTLYLDKQIATFMGRPPFISHRFVSFEQPLDLTTDQLWTVNDIETLRKTLDPQGWNIAGEIHHCTKVRVMFVLIRLRDEILELSLTVTEPEDLSDQIDRLRVRLEDCFNTFPPKFRLPINKAFFTSVDIYSITAITATQLWHWHNVFLCERIRHERQDQGRFLHAAQQMLSIVNMYWSERDRYPGNRDACHWWICCYGIPAASALAIDLWKQTVSPLTYPASSSRAYRIQDLNMFVASLDWVDERFGNYELCQRIKRTLNEILIHILDPNIAHGSITFPGFGNTTADNALTDLLSFDMDNLDAWFTLTPVN